MKIKILSLALALTLAFGCCAFARTTYTDLGDDAELAEAVNMLDSLGIISGMGDGTFHPYENLTRAQFAKIATYLVGKEDSAVSTSLSFEDVPDGHWATGYIGLVSDEGIIAGYPNGTFGADEEITYAQAVTVVVRTLGYSGEDVGYRWPDGYIEKAQAIGLLDGITIPSNDTAITRADAVKLCYNALFTDMKSGGELISLRDVTRAQDVTVIADDSIDVSLGTDTVKTDIGNFKITLDSVVPQDMVGTLGDLYYNDDKEIVIYTPDTETVRSIVVTSAVKNSDTNKVEISYVENGVSGTESFAANYPLYNEGDALTMGTGYSLMTEGSELKLFYDEKGSIQRGVLYTDTLVGPKTVTGDSFSVTNAFGITDTSNLKVYRKGLTASLDDIERFDVLYYAENINTLYAYADRVTGIYEKASPNKANVTSITLSGTTYELATQEAINKLNESDGAFAINDRVTLLKGRNGEIVDAVDTDSADLMSYGVIQNAYMKLSEEDDESEGRGDYWVTMFMGDGSTADYKCDRDYTDYIGEFRKLNFSNGILSLEKISYTTMTGTLDKTTPSFAGKWFANDYGIIELISLPEEGAATLRKVSLSEIGADTLSKSEVIHVQTTGSMDYISILYLKNVTNEQYTYGVVKEIDSEKGSSLKTYTMLLGSEEKEISTRYVLDAGQAIGYGMDEDGEDTFKDLVKVAEGNAITSKSSNRIKLDDEIYTISDSAVAYGGDLPKNYRALSLDDLVGMENVKSVELYSDRSLSNGGTIKVIIVRTK